jgi:hypothetical protein
MQLEPSEIAAKCSSFDVHARRDERKSEPRLPQPQFRPPSSALSQTSDNETHDSRSTQTLSFRKQVVSPLSASWQQGSRVQGGIASSFVDNKGFEEAQFASQVASRLNSRSNGTNGSTVTESDTRKVGFYGKEEATKPREFASDVPFTARSSQSDASVISDDAKHAADTVRSSDSETVAVLQRYRNTIYSLLTD